MEEANERPSHKAEDGGGRRIELEAAEALAALAHSSSSSTRNRETDDFAGDKLEGCSQPVKNKSSSADASDLAEVVKDGSWATSATKRSSVNSEREVVLKPSFMCNRDHLSVSGHKSQHNLPDQAEKEERRIRRVLANRESARQTIRRRQAIYEELTRKAADLAMENENLKSEKDQALREYDYLKGINKRLKAQVAEMDKAEAKKNQGDLGSTCGKGLTSTFGTPALPCNQPSMVPFFSLSSIQPSEAFRLPRSCQKCISIASQVHVQPIAKTDSDREQEYSRMSFQTGNPIYVLPFPWFFPFHTQCNAHNPQSSDHNATHDNASLNLPCSTNARSKAEVQMENQHLSLTAKINSEVPCSTEMKCSPHETRCSLPQDEGGDTRTTSSVLNLAPISCDRPLENPEPSHRPQENVQQGDIRTIHVAPGPSPNRMLEKNEGTVIFPNRKSASAIVAAEARKRRKELTKLKNLHCTDSRMH